MENLTLENCREKLKKDIVVKNSSIFGKKNKYEMYVLEEELSVVLSNGDSVVIPKGFKHDKSSVLKVFTPLLVLSSVLAIIGSFGGWFVVFLVMSLLLQLGISFLLFWAFKNTDLASIIHDFLYKEKCSHYSRKFCDMEFYKWLMACNRTNDPVSSANLAMFLFYIGVYLVGWKVFCKN